jgi:hypothetical protein
MNFDTPVALFIFNRPLLTARVFSRIAGLRPRRLLLIADGPRDASESRACDAARAIVEEIDWDCDVQRNFSDVNLGCKRRMSSGIDWVFSQADRAILLEDDCLPDMSFFPYCRELLERYEADERVMTISGDNFQFGSRHTPHSYYFSAVHHIWGWATWRRAWQYYDVDMKQWPAVAQTDFPGALVPPYAAKYQKQKMAEAHAGRIDSWDHQWTFACWMRQALCVLPAVNLISNIGFGPGATHCRKPDALAALPTEEMTFPLSHPTEVDLCTSADSAFLERAITAKAA